MRRTLLFFSIMLLSVSVLRAQQAGTASTDTTKFSLQQAIDYSIERQYAMLKARLELKNTEARFKEVRGIGLPQIEGAVDFQNYLKLPTTVIPASAFDPSAPPGAILEANFGTKFNTSATVSASQILFSSDYMVALQATKGLRELTQQDLTRTEIETAYNVSKAYYLVLVTQERIKMIDIILVRMEKMLADTKAMYEAGFVEKLDYDRLQVSYNNLIIEKQNVTTSLMIVETMLKFQMGKDVNSPIVLTDSLNMTNFDVVQVDTTSNIEQRIEYNMLKTQMRLNQLDLKRYKLAYTPTLAAYANLGLQAYRFEFNFFDFDQKWYPFALWGVKLNVPIFDGMQKGYRVQQARIRILKTEADMAQLESSLAMDIRVSAINYQNALNSLKTQKDNMELALNVSNVSQKKYKEGVGSNLEVVTSESSYKEAEVNYFNALYNTMVAKLDYEKAKGILYNKK